MKPSEKQKANEIPDISVADARSDPWAVMVMDLDADVAGAAMKCPWRSQNVASLAVTKIVMLIFLGFRLIDMFKLVQSIEAMSIIWTAVLVREKSI